MRGMEDHEAKIQKGQRSSYLVFQCHAALVHHPVRAVDRNVPRTFVLFSNCQHLIMIKQERGKPPWNHSCGPFIQLVVK